MKCFPRFPFTRWGCWAFLRQSGRGGGGGERSRGSQGAEAGAKEREREGRRRKRRGVEDGGLFDRAKSLCPVTTGGVFPERSPDLGMPQPSWQSGDTADQ